MREESIQRLVQGKEALSRGDLKKALAEFSASIREDVNPEAYFLKAETHFLMGDFIHSFYDLDRLETLCQKLPNKSAWDGLIAQARARYESPEQHSFNSSSIPVQKISVLLPTNLSDTAAIVTKVNAHSGLKMDGKTLVHQNFHFVCDVLGRNPELAQKIISWRDQKSLSNDLIRRINAHAYFLLIETSDQVLPRNVEQSAAQTILAVEILQTVNALMDAVNAPVAYFRHSTLVHTRQDIAKFCADLTAKNLVDAYASSFYEDNVLFSVGMKYLGYADAQMRDDVASTALAPDVLYEFMVYQLVNEQSLFDHELRFRCSTTGVTYDLVHGKYEKYKILDGNEDLSSSPYGIWSIEKDQDKEFKRRAQNTSQAHVFQAR